LIQKAVYGCSALAYFIHVSGGECNKKNELLPAASDGLSSGNHLSATPAAILNLLFPFGPKLDRGSAFRVNQ